MALRTRLIVAVSIVVALVLGIESVVEIRLFEQTAARELRETGRVTAQSAPSIRTISVVQLEDQ